jgi:hypothetical protein
MIGGMIVDVETMTETTNHVKVCTLHYAAKSTQWLTATKSAIGHVRHLDMIAATTADEIARRPESQRPVEIGHSHTGRMTATVSEVAMLLCRAELPSDRLCASREMRSLLHRMRA